MRADGHHVGGDGYAASRHVDDGAVISHTLAAPSSKSIMREITLNDGKFAVLNHFNLLQKILQAKKGTGLPKTPFRLRRAL